MAEVKQFVSDYINLATSMDLKRAKCVVGATFLTAAPKVEKGMKFGAAFFAVGVVTSPTTLGAGAVTGAIGAGAIVGAAALMGLAKGIDRSRKTCRLDEADGWIKKANSEFKATEEQLEAFENDLNAYAPVTSDEARQLFLTALVYRSEGGDMNVSASATDMANGLRMLLKKTSDGTLPA